MHGIYAKTKTYLINEIAEDARGVLSAIEGKDPVAVDDIEVLEYCHALATESCALATLLTSCTTRCSCRWACKSTAPTTRCYEAEFREMGESCDL